LGFFYSLLGSNGVEVSGNNPAVFEHKEKLIQSFNWFRNLVEKNLVSPEDVAGPALFRFNEFGRDSALQYSFGWTKLIKNFEGRKKVTLSPFPRGPSFSGNQAPFLGTAWAVIHNTANPELALQGLKFVRQKEYVKRCELEGGEPFNALKTIWDDPEVLEQHPYYKDAEDFFKVKSALQIDTSSKSLLRFLEQFGEAVKNRLSGEEWLALWLKEKPSPEQKGIQSSSILDALNYIDKNIASIKNVGQVANEVSRTPEYFSRLFSKEVGMSCEAYLKKIRMEEARKLLIDTSLSIKEICYKTGFSDPDYFGRVFHKFWKMTPSQLRKKEKNR